MNTSTVNGATTAAATPETDRTPDPREALDPMKQVMVIALLTCGFSRRAAARHVGCSHSSIARAVARDPHFAAQLIDAEYRADFNALKIVRNAAQQEKYWRAAAWILERRLPDDFGPPRPNTFSGDQVMALLAEVFSYTQPALREDKADEFMRAFNGTLRDVEAKVRQGSRGRDLAIKKRDESNPDAGTLRSPYEHPQWYDTDKSDVADVVGVPLLPSVTEAIITRVAPAAMADDVCQSSQKRGKTKKKGQPRNPLPHKVLERMARSVPQAEEPWGGPLNGQSPVHIGNGHS
jgi:hypothetical protein